LTALYTEYYYWVEENVPLPGQLKLRRYLEKLNEVIIELRGTPMTDREIQRAKLAADALAEKTIWPSSIVISGCRGLTHTKRFGIINAVGARSALYQAPIV
jgi:hypothetical protein